MTGLGHDPGMDHVSQGKRVIEMEAESLRAMGARLGGPFGQAVGIKMGI